MHFDLNGKFALTETFREILLRKKGLSSAERLPEKHLIVVKLEMHQP